MRVPVDVDPHAEDGGSGDYGTEDGPDVEVGCSPDVDVPTEHALRGMSWT
jgi:hypothetical protein